VIAGTEECLQSRKICDWTTRQPFGAVIPCMVCKAVKDRLITTVLAVGGVVFVIYSVAWAHTALEESLNLRPCVHMTLEASLNVLWLLLAIGAFAHWLAPDHSRPCTHLAGLVALVFVLSLLFPVISANDDLALDLVNDAKTSQSMVSRVQGEKQLRGLAGLLGSLALPSVQLASSPAFASEFVSEPTRAASVAAPGDATGNHSPPHY
jgi:hypothetical protein